MADKTHEAVRNRDGIAARHGGAERMTDDELTRLWNFGMNEEERELCRQAASKAAPKKATTPSTEEAAGDRRESE